MPGPSGRPADPGRARRQLPQVLGRRGPGTDLLPGRSPVGRGRGRGAPGGPRPGRRPHLPGAGGQGLAAADDYGWPLTFTRSRVTGVPCRSELGISAITSTWFTRASRSASGAWPATSTEYEIPADVAGWPP